MNIQSEFLTLVISRFCICAVYVEPAKYFFRVMYPRWATYIHFLSSGRCPSSRLHELANPHIPDNLADSHLYSIWQSFIPFESFQVFQRGGYYSVEVIPEQVAAVSLNTMYFYDSNKGE